jgi:hypothetical protein
MEIKELLREGSAPENPSHGPDTTILDHSLNQMSTIHPQQNMNDSRAHLIDVNNSSFDEDILFFPHHGKAGSNNLTKVSKTDAKEEGARGIPKKLKPEPSTKRKSEEDNEQADIGISAYPPNTSTIYQAVVSHNMNQQTLGNEVSASPFNFQGESFLPESANNQGLRRDGASGETLGMLDDSRFL